MTKSVINPFSFENHQIRTYIIDSELWFVATDVCSALKIANVTDALYKLDDDEKTTLGLTESQAGMGAQSICLISESGMYTLVLRCRDAVKQGMVPHRFRKWVTNEVLPSIRKTGSYSYSKNPNHLEFECSECAQKQTLLRVYIGIVAQQNAISNVRTSIV